MNAKQEEVYNKVYARIMFAPPCLQQILELGDLEGEALEAAKMQEFKTAQAFFDFRRELKKYKECFEVKEPEN